MEVVGHEAVGEHSHLAEFFIQTHESDELRLFFIAEDMLSVHDARDTVVTGRRPRRRSKQARLTHEGKRDIQN